MADGEKRYSPPTRWRTWTAKRQRDFIETLEESCDVREAARVAGMTASSAHELRRTDPAFARRWAQAVAAAYVELEMLLLREALVGAREEEVVTDDAGVVKTRKVKHGHVHAVGLRLLLAHRLKVKLKAGGPEGGAGDWAGEERPDSPAVIERLRVALAEVRARRLESG